MVSRTFLSTALLVPAALVAFAPALRAQSESEEDYAGERADRYASLRILEGDATIRKGDVEEPLDRGVPIGEGDVVESHGRGVLQLADGTRIAFGSDTRFEVAGLFTDEDQDSKILLRLDYGRLRVAMGRESEAGLRIDTPSGSAVLSDGSEAGIELEKDRTVRVKVHSGRAVFENERDRATLLAGERLTAYGGQDRLDRVQAFNTYGGDAFDTWCASRLTVQRGPSWDKVPSELRYYSDELDGHGEWVYVDEYQTWCWRPLGVSADWRPYWHGRWAAYPGGMTWVSDEPWGYVTYHHGRWGWGVGVGWYWIPGVYYAPAWVAWQTSGAYFGWAPMGYYGRPVSWGYGAWGGGYCWNIVEINILRAPHIHRYTHYRPDIIRPFNPPPRPSGNRPLSPPWHRTPVMVSQTEFRSPERMRRALQDPAAMRARMRTDGRQAGHVAPPRPSAPPSGARPTVRTEAPRPAPRPTTGPVMGSSRPNRPLARPQPAPKQAEPQRPAPQQTAPQQSAPQQTAPQQPERKPGPSMSSAPAPSDRRPSASPHGTTTRSPQAPPTRDPSPTTRRRPLGRP